MQAIYNYIPETNHVSLVYSVAAVLYLKCATCNVISPMKYGLYFYISTIRGIFAVPNAAVLFISLILCFPGMFLRNCLSNFEMVPVIPVINVVTFAFTFRIR